MSKNQFTGTATQPQRNRKLRQFNKDQYCTVCLSWCCSGSCVFCMWNVLRNFYLFFDHSKSWELLLTCKKSPKVRIKFALLVILTCENIYECKRQIKYVKSKKINKINLANVQSTLDFSNSDILNSAKLEASIWIKNTFWLLSQTISLPWILFYKSKLPEVQINLHFG